ncbi:glycosyltransferase family 2 protein [Sporolactobacillus sp. THM19-2]|uniref:teichuronic acid biosynthesis protein TuaG n=1 Tax=Sporolactobacillus sp. THM19-2 TaxID=2511171 RepID=UPI00101FF6B5|nr:glycosyltransferase family 2 protein [Sporolactobacillus sp. THM19-2]RYL89270.1 glycosyltransferase family 2 protein [Sporolactobacillus sp. THM19-2]
MVQMDPEVSVITPAWNAEKTIEEVISSVRAQTFANWEMVIVDDGSSDGTQEKLVAAMLADERIHPVFLSENSGAAAARNKALYLARGRYVAFLDSDDRWKPDKLAKQLAFMKKHQYAFTFTGYEYMDASGRPLNKIIHAPQRVTYHDLLKNTIVGCLTVMIDRNQTGRFQMPDLRSRQDLATWLKLLKQGFTAYGLDENLSAYRVGSRNALSGNKWKAAKKTWFVFRRVEGLPLPEACWYFCHYAANAAIKRFS